jgi:NitT/TauT family transport system substrate-binding protein
VFTGSRRRFLAAAAAAGAAGATRYAGAQGVTTVRIAGTPSDDMTPILYGQHSGLFNRFGLDVQLTNATSGAAAAAAVSSGTYAFGKSSLTTLLVAHEKGIPYTLVASDVVYDAKTPYAAFIADRDAGLRTGKDFNDKLIAVSALGDMGSVALQAWVEARGGDPKSLRFVEIPLSAAIAAVDNHRVAAAETSIPVLAAAIESGKAVIPAYDTIAPTFLLAAWFTTTGYSAKNPQAVRQFARAFAASAAYTNAHHAETAAMMAEFTGVAVGVVERMTRTIAGTSLLPAQIQPVIDSAAKYGALKRAFPAKEVIDPNAVT